MALRWKIYSQWWIVIPMQKHSYFQPVDPMHWRKGGKSVTCWKTAPLNQLRLFECDYPVSYEDYLQGNQKIPIYFLAESLYHQIRPFFLWDQTKIELWFQIITVPWCGQCSTRTPDKLCSILLLQARGMRKGVEEWEGGFGQGQGLCVAFNNIEMNSNVKEWGSKNNRRRMLALTHSDIVGKTTATRMEKQL